MAGELGLVSLTQLLNLAKLQGDYQTVLNPSSITTSSRMWNPKQQHQSAQEDKDDSWEVRAFAEDTNHAMGTTWPPRSYTCTFCRREFRSAQALGGHMNVHRRDRARLHQATPNPAASSSSSTFIIPTQEFAANGGLCLLYSLPNPSGSVFPPANVNACVDSSSTFLSISPNHVSTSPNYNYPQTINFPVASPSINSSLCHSGNNEPSASIDNDYSQNNNCAVVEELDLELRLGRSSSPS